MAIHIFHEKRVLSTILGFKREREGVTIFPTALNSHSDPVLGRKTEKVFARKFSNYREALLVRFPPGECIFVPIDDNFAMFPSTDSAVDGTTSPPPPPSKLPNDIIFGGVGCNSSWCTSWPRVVISPIGPKQSQKQNQPPHLTQALIGLIKGTMASGK